MTRINCIPVEQLLDQHLFAEYREITRVASLQRSLPDYGKYTMGTGHVKFFYNKGLYLADRCNALLLELAKRGFNVQVKHYPKHGSSRDKQWSPTRDDELCNLMRLVEKQRARPEFYKLNGKPAPSNHYLVLLENLMKIEAQNG